MLRMYPCVYVIMLYIAVKWNRKVKREERIKKKKEKWIEEGMEKMEG